MKKFKAFTLLEIIIALTIIGLISAAIIHSTKVNQTQYKKLYWTAYYTLLQTAGNANANWNPDTEDIKSDKYDDICNGDRADAMFWTKTCWENHEKGVTNNIPGFLSNYPRKYPHYLLGAADGRKTDLKTFYDDTNQAFCQEMTKNINTVDEQNQCNWFITDTDTIDIASLTPSFIAANGQKYYISNILFANAPFGYTYSGEDATDTTKAENNQKTRLPFRIIAVDINGDNAPNTHVQKGSRLPDIVFFALTSDGKVVTLGLPEFNQTYVKALVNYPKWIKEEGVIKENENGGSSQLMSLYEAKLHAYAYAVPGYYGQLFVPEIPYSFSNLMYYWGMENCSDRTDGADNNAITRKACSNYYVDKQLADLVKASLNNKPVAELITENKIDAAAATVNTGNGCETGGTQCSIVIDE